MNDVHPLDIVFPQKCGPFVGALPASDDQDPRPGKLLETNEITGVGTDSFGEPGSPFGELAEVSDARGSDDDVGRNLGSVVERGHECVVIALEADDVKIADGYVLLVLEPGGVL